MVAIPAAGATVSDGIKIEMSPDIGSLMERVRAHTSLRLHAGVLKAAQYAAGELRRKVQSTFKQRTGQLGRSFLPTSEITVGKGSISAGAFSDLICAKIQDEGGIITPKNRKFLAIPISSKARNTVGLWPRHWPKGQLVFLKDRAGGRLIEIKGKKNPQVILHYLLRRSAKITGRHYIAASENAVRDAVRQIIAGSVSGEA
jgi:hypothetical protein